MHWTKKCFFWPFEHLRPKIFTRQKFLSGPYPRYLDHISKRSFGGNPPKKLNFQQKMGKSQMIHLIFYWKFEFLGGFSPKFLFEIWSKYRMSGPLIQISGDSRIFGHKWSEKKFGSRDPVIEEFWLFAEILKFREISIVLFFNYSVKNYF